MSTIARLLCALLLLAAAIAIMWPTSPRAQEMADAPLLAASATEGSILATQIADRAYSPSGDVKAVESFQNKADEVASLLQQIASESALGKGVGMTGPLFDQAASLALDALRVAREGGITIDPAIADEFARQITELEKQFHQGPATSATEVPKTPVSLP